MAFKVIRKKKKKENGNYVTVYARAKYMNKIPYGVLQCTLLYAYLVVFV